jgi:hypothetical protein
MKTTASFAVTLLVLGIIPARSQAPQPPQSAKPPMVSPGGEFNEMPATIVNRASEGTAQSTVLTRFSLDFPGGTPKELTFAIEKSMGRPVNAIVPEEHANIKLPPLRMEGATVPDLFRALEQASVRTVPYATVAGDQRVIHQKMTSYGFRTASGDVTDNTVWYFRVDGLDMPALNPEKSCRFFSLAPYLEQGCTVDEITMVVKTGWEMQAEGATPRLNFNKETRLLIAVGDPAKLETIDAVLAALQTSRRRPADNPPATLSLASGAQESEQK